MHLSNANNERELLSHHPSDDDRDPGPRKPKSSGFFGGLVSATRTNQTSNNKRSVPPPVSRQSGRRRQQHVDAEFIDLLAERLSLSSGQKSKGTRGTTTNSADQQFDLLNDSSVHLLLHDDEDEEEAKGGGGSSGSSSGSSRSFCSSDEEHEDQLIVVEDLVVGSKFARQLSKSHSVLVEGNSVVLLDSSSGGDHHHHLNHQAPPQALLIPRRPTVPGNEIPSVPESPTRFCFVDGTNQVSVRDTVLRYCDQTEPLRFGDVYSERVLRQCRKVGEGVYSEVFMYRQADESSDEGKAIVLKVIPIEGELIVNGEVQKKFDEILSEIIISKELSDLRYDPRNKTNGFVNVERVRCVRGKYPGYLVDLWELYDDNHGSDNDHPEVFGEEQLFIVLELENAGQDLEAFNFTNAVQGHSAFLQTVLTLAVAESKYEFEHRDLHWGNILLRHTDEREAHFVVNGKRFSVPTEGVQVTIIDYTLSRMLYKRNYLQFNDLAHDEDLFSATGDYQYEIYRLMRKRLGNVWSSFEPYTNVLWLHYVIDKLINGARYRLKQSKKHKGAIKDMIKLRDQVPDSKSAVDLAQLVVVAAE